MDEMLGLPSRGVFAFVHVPDKYAGWEGTTEELARVALKELDLSESQDGDDDERLTRWIRLIRYYVTMGVIDRPIRQGKEARFGFRHLVQLFVVRKALEQRVPLKYVRDEMLKLTPSDWAQIEGYRSHQVGEKADKHSRPFAASASNDVQVQDDSATADHADLSISAFGHDKFTTMRGVTKRRWFIQWDLNRWCQVQIDAYRAGKLTVEEAHSLGQALTSTLLEYHQRLARARKTKR